MNRLLGTILLFIGGISLSAQDITVLVESPGVVAVGEQFMVTWVVNQRGGQFEPPQFTNFYKLMGPQTSFSSSTQIINGKVSSEIRNSYSYYLQATREGKFTIEPAKYIDKKKEYHSDPVEIEVVKEKQQVQSSTIQSNTDASPGTSASNNDLYIRLLVNRTKVYMGEHIVATLKIYSKINLSGIQEFKFPDFNSFLKEDIETPQARNLERENVNGEIYGTAVLQRFLLFPQRSGKIEIDPATITVLIQERMKSNDPFFGDFFSSFNTVPRALATLPVEIEVMPLPAGAPPSFSGTVGDVKINSSIDKDSLAVNDALTYRITLSGNGNLKLTSPPRLNISPDIEIYEPKTTSNIKPSVNGASGSVVYEYILIPRYHGSYTIPSFEFTYFDPATGKYITNGTGEKHFRVTRLENDDTATEVFGGISKEDIRYLGKDIRHIKTAKPVLRDEREMIVDKYQLFMLYGGLLLVFGLIILVRKEQVRRNSDFAKVRNRKAGKVAAQRLKRAASHLKQDNPQHFYSELLKATWGYLGDKLNIPVAELTRDKTVAALKARKMDEKVVDMTVELIDICELSRYSMAGNEKSPHDIYRLAVSVIKTIENNI